jgi:hypothetical protein
VNLNELINELNKLFPNETWKEYDIEINVIRYHTEPIPYVPNPYPPTYPWVTYRGDSTSVSTTKETSTVN